MCEHNIGGIVTDTSVRSDLGNWNPGCCTIHLMVGIIDGQIVDAATAGNIYEFSHSSCCAMMLFVVGRFLYGQRTESCLLTRYVELVRRERRSSYIAEVVNSRHTVTLFKFESSLREVQLGLRIHIICAFG